MTTHDEQGMLKAVQADRDEWRTQHENLLGIYREQTRTLFRRTEMLRRALAYLPRTLGIMRDIREELPPANETTDEIHAIDAAIAALPSAAQPSVATEGEVERLREALSLIEQEAHVSTRPMLFIGTSRRREHYRLRSALSSILYIIAEARAAQVTK